MFVGSGDRLPHICRSQVVRTRTPLAICSNRLSTSLWLFLRDLPGRVPAGRAGAVRARNFRLPYDATFTEPPPVAGRWSMLMADTSIPPSQGGMDLRATRASRL